MELTGLPVDRPASRVRIVGRKRRAALPPWGESVKRLLREKGLTNREVANAIGMSEQQLSDLVNDPDGNPEYKQLQRLAEGIGVDVAQLFGPPRAEGIHVGTVGRAAPAVDHHSLRSALRAAFTDVLTDILQSLAPRGEDAPTRRSDSSLGDEETKGRPAPPDNRRAVR